MYSGQIFSVPNNFYLATKKLTDKASILPCISVSGFSFKCGLAGKRAGVAQEKFSGALKSRFEL